MLFGAKIYCGKKEVYITGIDMSSAFDAIKRHDLVDVLQTFLNEDEWRMARLLLSNTTINIQFGNSKTPQGDKGREVC